MGSFYWDWRDRKSAAEMELQTVAPADTDAARATATVIAPAGTLAAHGITVTVAAPSPTAVMREWV